MAKAMMQAGFRQVLIEFESGNPNILSNINKRATVEQNTRWVNICHRHGLAVKALMSAGHPGETLATIAATRDWLLKVHPDDFDATIITVYPGTPYFDDARETSPDVWRYTAPKTGDTLHARTIDPFSDVPHYKAVPGAYRAFVWTDHFSSEVLVLKRDRLEAEVREALHPPYPTAPAAINFEHSMGRR
jgi:anaerobic magnesium-protoporphyrin IX monomethyl ester cyclase